GAMSELQQILYLGTSAQVSAQAMAEAITRMATDSSEREAMSRRNRELVDGRGTQRFARLPLQPELHLRQASLEDSARIHQWRNSPVNREQSFDTAEIPFESHEHWFKGVVSNPDRPLLIGENGRDAVGVLRYDILGDKAVVSVYLVPGFHGKG